MPRIEFDVKIEESTHRGARGYIEMLGNHDNMKIEFEDVKKAERMQQAMYMHLSRSKIYNIRPMRRKNIVFLIKENGN